MLLIYGANGYTGLLIVDECVRRGIRPVVAGRRDETLIPIAAEHALERRAFPLDDPGAIAAGLSGVTTVIHAAGPFADTSAPMVEGCLDAGVHYLDITGELEVFENCRERNDDAKRAGIVLLPGVGFDVVPTDCLAARLAERLPGATLLELAFAGGGGASRGTRKTMQRSQHQGGAVRRNGVIERVPVAWKQKLIPFRDRPRHSVTIPWGDVSTAYWSTGIPDIHVYLAVPAKREEAPAEPRTAEAPARAQRAWDDPDLDARLAGPSAEVRASSRMQIWGRVSHADGRSLEGTAVTPEGYVLTALASVECAARVMQDPPTAGYHTPSTAFGSGFLEELPGCEITLGEIVHGEAERR